MKNMKKIVSVMLTIMMVCGMWSVTFADGGIPTDFSPDQSGVGETAKKVANSVLGLLTVIAGAIAVGMLVYIGIKYMTKGAGAKAEVKDTLLPYLIGAVLVAGAAGIANAVLTIGANA